MHDHYRYQQHCHDHQHYAAISNSSPRKVDSRFVFIRHETCEIPLDVEKYG
jgi:hypothetical protein